MQSILVPPLFFMFSFLLAWQCSWNFGNGEWHHPQTIHPTWWASSAQNCCCTWVQCAMLSRWWIRLIAQKKIQAFRFVSITSRKLHINSSLEQMGFSNNVFSRLDWDHASRAESPCQNCCTWVCAILSRWWIRLRDQNKKRFNQVSFNQIWSFYIIGLELHNASQRESSHCSVWKFSRCQAARV